MALVFQLTSNGIVVPSQQEVVDFYTQQFQTIYGSDINVGPETPDGQMINIFAQTVKDATDLLTQINNQFDPDNAIGEVLDQRVAINGIQRQAGTFTVTDVTVTTDRSLNFFGLDQTVEDVYTVSDSAGNAWQLQNTQLGAGAGTNVFVFQAASPGALTTIPNTITTPVTILLGVLTINNPTTYTTLGLNEETDAALRIRRQKSTAISNSGFFNGLLAALLNINGVTYANIIENTTSGTDMYGVPGHTIWVIMAGTGSASEIAQAIYAKRSAGCGLYSLDGSSSVSFDITQLDNSIFTVVWDNAVSADIFAGIEVVMLNPNNDPLTGGQIDAIRGSLPLLYMPGVGASVNINQLATYVQAVVPDSLVTDSGFGLTASDANIFADAIETPNNPNEQFQFTSDNIIITPMVVDPGSSEIVTGGSQTFLGHGGYGTYSYVLSANNSGGTIGVVTGDYVAGTTGSVFDLILVTDTLGNTAAASVNVV